MIYKDYIGGMENEVETTIVNWGYIRENGKQNGNYYSILGLYRENGKEMETTIWGLGRVSAGFDVGGQVSQESGHGASSRIGGIPPGCKDC